METETCPWRPETVCKRTPTRSTLRGRQQHLCSTYVPEIHLNLHTLIRSPPLPAVVLGGVRHQKRPCRYRPTRWSTSSHARYNRWCTIFVRTMETTGSIMASIFTVHVIHAAIAAIASAGAYRFCIPSWLDSLTCPCYRPECCCCPTVR